MADVELTTAPVPALPSVREEAPEVMGDLLGMLAHDIRNPLAALSSNVGYLSMVGQNLPDDIRETIVDLQLSLEVLGRMADTLELLAHDLAGASSTSQGPIHPRPLLEGLMPSLEKAAGSHGVRITANYETQAICFGRENALARAIAALAHNAIACAPAGSTVTVRVLEDSDGVRFRVEDEGTPLADEFASLAFTAYGQTQTKGRLDGRYSRGLGLFVAGRSAALAGARVMPAAVDRRNRFDLLVPQHVRAPSVL